MQFPWKLYKTLFSGHAQHVLTESHFSGSKLSKSSHWPQILQKEKTVRFSWKLYKTLFSAHAEHVLTESHFSVSKLSKSSRWPQILSKKRKLCAFFENCTKRSFQVMRSTFWPNRICERQSCQNRHAGLKVSAKIEKRALFMKIVQKPLFRLCGARFGKIAFLSVKVVKVVRLASNSLQKGKTLRFSLKLYKTLFSGHASTIWPNRIFERQSSQNRHTGLKFSSKRENCALFMKIVQNALFRSCIARFGQIAFLSVKVVKIVTLASNSLQIVKTVRFLWKLYKTLFSGHAQHVLTKLNFSVSKVSKSSHWPQILFKKRKLCAFHENCTKCSFQVMPRTFWPNRIFERQKWQNRHTGLKFSPKRENCALFMKIVQNALSRSCVNGFDRIAFFSVKVVKIVTLASNSLQKEKTVRFSWKLYKTLFSAHAEHVLAKSHFWASEFSNSSH